MSAPEPPVAGPGAAPQRRPPAVGDAPPEAARREVILRRAPRYRAFVGTGAVLGAVIAVVATLAFPNDGRFSTSAILGYVGVSLTLLGALLGAGAAVLLDRQRPR